MVQILPKARLWKNWTTRAVFWGRIGAARVIAKCKMLIWWILVCLWQMVVLPLSMIKKLGCGFVKITKHILKKSVNLICFPFSILMRLTRLNLLLQKIKWTKNGLSQIENTTEEKESSLEFNKDGKEKISPPECEQTSKIEENILEECKASSLAKNGAAPCNGLNDIFTEVENETSSKQQVIQQKSDLKEECFINEKPREGKCNEFEEHNLAGVSTDEEITHEKEFKEAGEESSSKKMLQDPKIDLNSYQEELDSRKSSIKSPINSEENFEDNQSYLDDEVSSDSDEPDKDIDEGLLQDKDIHNLNNKGINNLGNTCFIASTLQSLLSNSDLLKYFLSKAENDDGTTFKSKKKNFKKNLKKDPSNQTEDNTSVTQLFKELLRWNYNPTKTSIVMTQFRKVFEEQFPLGQQEDASKLMLELFEELQKERNIDHSHFDNSGYKNDDHAWSTYSKNHMSIIDRLYVGMEKNVFKCKECSAEISSYEPFKSIPLELSSQNQKLHRFFTKSNTKSSSMFFCDSCQDVKNCKITNSITKYPKYLILTLQRFDPFTNSKITSFIDYPESFKKSTQNSSHTYSLNSVICHSGSLYGGHYTSTCRRNGKWTYFSDSYVGESSEKVPFERNAYILVYKRC
ncbi:unnamed protein product [Moneuplotes crassus]|uniref:Ubiquitin carboxyl-terminal hydrolase n=1 Tax=Euplotes crassus TaxID=5936 RepID=A0AAD1U2K5_EUPCR|nr:unnamed protein product [Moneuplotes crassus]